MRAVVVAVRWAVLALLLTLALLPVSVSAEAAGPGPDYPVENGWFFTQTGGGDGKGYAVTDNDGIGMWTRFQQVGGVGWLGYPVSQRWVEGAFTYQAFQKAILQHQPGRGIFYVNIHDRLHNLGQDEWLLTAKNVPPPREFPEDEGQPFSVVVANHLKLLESNQEIKAKWYANSDWLNAYGLPVAFEEFDGLIVVRAQRAVFQQWLIPTSFTTVGGVVISNGGDHYKQADQIPAFYVTSQTLAEALGQTPEPEPEPEPAPEEQAGPRVVLSNENGWQEQFNVDTPQHIVISRISGFVENTGTATAYFVNVTGQWLGASDQVLATGEEWVLYLPVGKKVGFYMFETGLPYGGVSAYHTEVTFKPTGTVTPPEGAPFTRTYVEIPVGTLAVRDREPFQSYFEIEGTLDNPSASAVDDLAVHVWFLDATGRVVEKATITGFGDLDGNWHEDSLAPGEHVTFLRQSGLFSTNNSLENFESLHAYAYAEIPR